jgi:putative flippase GtrA
MDILSQFTHREAGPVVQFIKYAICGGVATAVHITVFHLFAWKILPALQKNDHLVIMLKLRTQELDDATRSRNSMIDNGLAFLFSNLTAYVMNVMWVFAPGRHSRWVEMGLFYAASGTAILIGTFLMGWLIRRFGMRTTFAFIANLVASLLINYAMRKYVIFKG